MDVVVLVPYRSDEGGRRDQLWEFTLGWLMKHHDSWAVITGESPEGPFNRGAAINDAARRAGDFDIAIIHDSDNIADPAMLKQAVERVRETKGCVFPFSTYLYLDEFSTDRLIKENNWFVCPERRWGNGYDWTVIDKHHSGVQVISREAYEQVGGFPELEGWGFEDSIMSVLLNTFAGGMEHLQGAAYHLWHGGGHDDPERKIYGTINQRVLGDVMALSVVPEQLRQYLHDGGHPIP